MLSVPISIRARCTTLCDKVRQWLATGRWFSLGLLFSSTNKTDRHDITEILLKMTLNTIKQTYDLIWTLFLFSEWRSTIWSSRWSDFPSRWWFWFKTWEESKWLLFSFFICIGGVMFSMLFSSGRLWAQIRSNQRLKKWLAQYQDNMSECSNKTVVSMS